MNTTWQQRRRFEQRLDNGESISGHETQRLIDDADIAERAEARLGALEEALLADFGIAVVDATTDDDPAIRIELIRAEGETE